MQNSEKIWRLVDARKDDYEALSDRVWGMPELCYGEFRSVAEHKAMLEQEGFRITENVAGIPTAVMGEAGEGGPVIASSANTTRCRDCRRSPVSRSRRSWSAAATGMAAATICLARPRCSPRPR
jgi:hypothetical protein